MTRRQGRTRRAPRRGVHAVRVAGRRVAGARVRLRASGGRWRSARGQTATEYLMITGFITMVGLFVMRVMQLPFQRLLGRMTSYVLNNAADLPW